MKKPRLPRKKTILGVTGGFGTGKTSVANFFKPFGAKIIDADKIAHESIKPGTPVYKKIINLFGQGILHKNRSINRFGLSKAVFDNSGLLRKLNKIVHPSVVKAIKEEIKHSANSVIILDVPLLFEAKLEHLVDKIIVVKASKTKQITRLSRRTPLSEEEIKKRINAQLPLSDKIRKADFVIDNNGSFEKTKKQLERLRRKLWKN